MKRVIERAAATDMDELIQILHEWEHLANAYVTINSDSVHLDLIEETLTDGSLVYNIELSAVAGVQQ